MLTPMRKLFAVAACLGLVAVGCDDATTDETFSATGVVVGLRAGIEPEGLPEPDVDLDGNSPSSGAVLIEIDNNSVGNFGDCPGATDPNQTVFFTQITTFLPEEFLSQPNFPESLLYRRVGADGPLYTGEEQCFAVAERFRIEGVDGAEGSPSPSPDASPTGSPLETATATATESPSPTGSPGATTSPSPTITPLFPTTSPATGVG